MKISVKVSSCIVTLFCWILFSVFALYVFHVTQDRARLLRDNHNEQIFNRLFTSLRDYDDYGSAIEASPALKERIIGLAIYREDLTPLYSWGNTPDIFDENILRHSGMSGNNRYTIDDKQNRSIKFILNIGRPVPAPRMQNRQGNHYGMRSDEMPRNFFFNTLYAGKYFYIDIYHPDYWRTINTARIIFPLCILLLFIIVFYFRNLYLRNIEYRKRIEDQKSLVVLGTAASTLAHEIKNPLLSIRLQTGILRKVFAENGEEEIHVIEEEVDRISALVYRVNDYLRDAVGFPVSLDVKELLQDIFYRLCGKNISCDNPDDVYTVYIDADRARSVFENIIRNAAESGGDENKIECIVSKNANQIVVEIADRGKGIPKQHMTRIFNPFFTSKSTGTGIGLSICKRFAEAAGGSVKLESRNGGGTLARITFPFYAEKN